MATNEYDYHPADLLGNVAVPRLTLPTIRSAKRRSDADGGSTVPYYPGINAKKLDIEYTDGALAIQTVSLTISGTGYQDLIDDIKALDPTNLEAIDMGGFLGIRNVNSGKTHYVKILPQTVSADEAADLLGLVTDPYPGSISYAGELASTPGHRTQQNPQGATLISKGDDLQADAFNRAFVSVIREIEKLRADLERDTIGYVDVNVTVQNHEVSTGIKGFYLNDPTIRLPIRDVDPSTDLGNMEGYLTLLDTTLKREVYDGTSKVQAHLVCYATSATALTGVEFTTWGTPDGGGIYAGTISNKVKHASVTITEIKGSVLYCPGATFSTLFIQKNDPVLISGATNTSPYDHNGWFAVVEVLDEEHLRVRPFGTNENIPAVGPQETPFAINPIGSGFGNVEIYFGDFVPASNMFITVQNGGLANGSYIARIACGRSLREPRVGRPFQHNGDPSAPITAHVTDPTDAHASTAISGFTSATSWFDGSTITGANLKATIEDILTDLASSGGTGRVGSPLITATGFNDPKTLAAGSLSSQLLSGLNQLQAHEVSSSFHPNTGWVSGFDLAAYSWPNQTVNAGVLVAEYLGEVRKFSISGTTLLSVTSDSISYVYVDLADQTIKRTPTLATAVSSTTVLLYQLHPQGFGMTWVLDFRIPLSSAYSRNKGIVTVGATGADFVGLESALFWVRYVGRAASPARTWEIVIQGNVVMDHSVDLDFPVTIRGAAKDASGTPLCKVTTTAGQFSDETIAFNTATGGESVVFRDIWFEIPSGVVNTVNKVIGTQFGHETGNNWVIDNCVFSGGTNAPYISVSPNSVVPTGWIIRDCWFKTATRTAATSHIVLDKMANWLIKGCRLEGQTADLFQTGITISGTGSDDNTIEDCYFSMGGRHIIVTGSGDRTLVTNCRFNNSRASAINHLGTGDLVMDGCWFTNCMTNSSVAEGVIWSDSVTNRIELRGCKFKNWATGHAVRAIANTGSNSRIVNCTFIATAVDRAVIGFNNALFMGNDFDLSPGASSGNGKDIGVVLSVGDNCRILGNFFRNCGSTATANTDNVIAFGDNTVASGNSFLNCRGTLMMAGTNGDNVVTGNICDDCGTGQYDVGFERAGTTRNFVFGNSFQNLTSASVLEMRPMFQLHQNWIAPMLASWSDSLAGAGSITAVLNDAATRPGVWLRLRCTNGATDVAGKFSPSILKGPLDAEIAVAAEFYLDVPGIYGTANDFYFHAGFCHDEGAGGATSLDDSVKIIKTDASTNFFFVTGGPGAITSTDTGVNANSGYKFRIEVLGSNEPGGAKAKLWINDILVATHTTNLPDDQAMPFAVVLSNTGETTAGNYDVYISPVTIEYKMINYL